ncbi:RidA family protein [Pseudomonas fluorescens]|uniref:RidA family protein n=1 Tax=Pseudomonas fluorescens TaxID=294 RepID=UPI0007321B70|nr:RidA family protein [Pseudomonas fluorescens]
MSIVRKHVGKRLTEIVIHNGTVYLAGQLADDFVGDVREQTRQTLANVDRKLTEAGTDKSKILSVTVYLKDINADFAGMNEAWDAWLDHEAIPARATVQAALYSPDVLVEMSITAAL